MNSRTAMIRTIRPFDEVDGTSPIAPMDRSEPRLAPTLDADLQLLHRAARRIVRSDDLAWDVVQEALVRDHLRNPHRRSPLPALRKLCSLIALSVLRARSRREHHEAEACGAASHRASDGDPAAALQNAELSALLAEALTTLPPEQREAFVLYELHGHSYACIAEQLDLPVGTVRSRIARARAGLRGVLGRTACAYTEGLAS